MYLNSEEDEMFLKMALKNHPRMPRNKRFIMYEMMEKFPMGHWAKLCASDEYVKIPPNFKWPEEEKKIAPEAAASKPKEERQAFHYARIETLYCVDDDLNFCEGLSKAYHRILEDRGEKIFLRGNIFLAKMAKAVFEQNEDIFVKACEKYADEKYFKECVTTLGKIDFILDEKLTKTSWSELYEIVLLLTSEYLATKCELPKLTALECKENSEDSKKLEIILANQSSVEKDIDTASLNPLMIDGMRSLSDSSDGIEIGDLFYEFLAENFPCKDSREEFERFMARIYGEEVCKDLGWLYEKLADNKLPRPEVKVDAMEEEDMLGTHDGETICINQRLVLDAISSKEPKDCFILLIAMLLEYGNFLNYVIHEKAGKPLDDSKAIGRTFAYQFINYSKTDLFNTDFEFADFTALDAKGKEQVLIVRVSGLNRLQRKNILYTIGSMKTWEGEF